MSVAVVEIGTRYTKCGFAGEGAPRYIIPKNIRQVENLHQPRGKADHLSFDITKQSHQSVSGAYSGGLGCFKPKEPPSSSDDPVPCCKTLAEWKPIIRRHLDEVFFGLLLCDPKDKHVVVVEDLLSPTSFRQAVAETLFDDLHAASVAFVPSCAVALLPTGSETGLVCDFGGGEARVLPVVAGQPVLAAYQCSPMGAGLTAEVHGLISAEVGDRGVAVGPSQLEDLIGRFCVVPPTTATQIAALEHELVKLDVPEELNEWLRRRITLLKMLDEAALPVEECMVPGLGKISLAARAAAEHVLFGGDSEGTTAGSLVVDAVRKCPADVRKAVLGNLVVAGGYAMLPGMAARLVGDVEFHLAKETALQGLRPSLRLARPTFEPNCLAGSAGRCSARCWPMGRASRPAPRLIA